MEISPASTDGASDEVRQALILKKAIKAQGDTSLALINSVSGQDQELNDSGPGQFLNVKA
ncbi:MAG TPA: hypothetical protein VFT72_08375 [Opitutaceae bacterium]|nr:hypothetical protein [Opitutaceae bacterium]